MVRVRSLVSQDTCDGERDGEHDYAVNRCFSVSKFASDFHPHVVLTYAPRHGTDSDFKRLEEPNADESVSAFLLASRSTAGTWLLA